MSEKHFPEVQPRRHWFPRSLVKGIALGLVLGLPAGVGVKTLMDRHNAEEAREQLNTISVAWRNVVGFKETQTDVIRFPGDPEQAGKARLDCDRIGMIAMTPAAVRTQITDRGWKVGVARWSTDNPDVAHIASLGSADQLGSRSRSLQPGETADLGTGAINDKKLQPIQTIGARVCDGTLIMGFVGIDPKGIPHGVRGTETVAYITVDAMAADNSPDSFMSVPIV